MKVRGFGAWPSRNSTIGGQRRSYDEINKACKGEAQFPKAEEYASRNVEEYHHYQEQQDLTVEPDEARVQKEKQKKQESQKHRKRMVQRAVVLVAGSIIIASAYKVSAQRRAQQSKDSDNGASATETLPVDNDNGKDNGGGKPQDGPPSTPDSASDTTAPTEANTSVSWEWSADGASATLIIKDSSGNVLSEIPATVTLTEDPAGCTTTGTLTYTATAEADGQTYTDARYESTPALGHTFDSGTEVTLEDGQTAMQFECNRCHEHFTIINSIDEE